MILNTEYGQIQVDTESTSNPNVIRLECVTAGRLDCGVFARDSTLSRKLLLRHYEAGIIRSYVYAIIESNRIQFAVESKVDKGGVTFGKVLEVSELERKLYNEFVDRIIAKRLALCETCKNRTYANELGICYYCIAEWRVTRTIERVKVYRDKVVYRDTNEGYNSRGRRIERPYSNIRCKIADDFEYIRIVESKDSQYFTEEVESYYLPGSNDRLPRKLWRGRETVVERIVTEL